MANGYRIVLATPAPVSHRTAEENLGLGYLAAILRQTGYRVDIIDGWLENLSPNEIAQRITEGVPPLLVGFSAYQANMNRALETVSILRQQQVSAPMVAGGFGPSFYPEQFLRAGFDFVLIGEGEKVLPPFCEYLIGGVPPLSEIPSLCYIDEAGEMCKNPTGKFIRDIDTLPFPARDTMHLAIKRRTPVHVLSSRGCAARCIFCSIVAFQKLDRGPTWRQRSITDFVDELEELTSQGARHFKVIDDSLIEPPRDASWCAALADEIENRGLRIKLRGSIRADRVTEEIVANLHRAGFFSFSCGIENFSPTALKRMGKSASLEDNIRALEIFKQYGIYVQAGHILFDHATTLSELKENYAYMKQYAWTISKGIFTEMYAAEGTPFTKLLDNKGLIQPERQHLGNYLYSDLTPEVHEVYKALQTWHKSHMRLYDMTIDPLSSPKALEADEYEQFHNIYMELRLRDLDFMASILQLASETPSTGSLSDYVLEKIAEAEQSRSPFEERVKAAYAKAGLVYDADGNPFMIMSDANEPIAPNPTG